MLYILVYYPVLNFSIFFKLSLMLFSAPERVHVLERNAVWGLVQSAAI